MKKYEFAEDCKILKDGTVVRRIKALKSFGDVHKGYLGGFIEKEPNLSHEGLCWVYDNAKVKGNAKLYNDVKVMRGSRVYDNARLYNNARVDKNSKAYKDTALYSIKE